MTVGPNILAINLRINRQNTPNQNSRIVKENFKNQQLYAT